MTQTLKDIYNNSIKEFEEKFPKDLVEVLTTTPFSGVIKNKEIKSHHTATILALLEKIVSDGEEKKRKMTSRFASMPKTYNKAIDTILAPIKVLIDELKKV